MTTEDWDNAINEVRAVNSACAYKEKIKQSLIDVKEYANKICPYRFMQNENGDVIGQVLDKRDEFLLGLATLIIHLIEKEEV